MKYRMYIYFIMISFFPAYVFSLEELTTSEMKKTSAQAGFSIILDDVRIVKTDHAITFIETEANDSYLSFEGIDVSLSLSAGMEDINNDGLLGCLDLDIFTMDDLTSPVYGNTYIVADAGDWDQEVNLQIKDIYFCGADVGALSVYEFSNDSFHMVVGSHDCGVDMTLAGTPTISEFTYHYNETESLTFGGLSFCSTFTGDPSDPSSWEKSGVFTMGDVFSGSPATIDIVGDDQAFFTIERDISDGGSYTVENPRYGAGYIRLNLPMSGSMRVENIDFAGMDFGPLAIDNINVHELIIEIPGRGIGG